MSAATGRRPSLSRVSLPLELRLAVRELRAGAGGFAVFMLCIALGVAAIAGIGSLAGALQQGIEREGRTILGGDVSLSLVHRRVSDHERAWLKARGTVSEVATLRAMARPAGEKRSALVRIKAVDGRYPLFGAVRLSSGDGPAPPLKDAISAPGTAAVEALLLERLGIAVGDSIRIGSADIRITAVLVSEPDQLSGRPPFGPRVLMTIPTFESTGLIRPGSILRWRYRLRLEDPGDAALAGFRAALERDLPEAGFTVRDRRNPSPSVRRMVRRFAQFLTLIGVTTLMIGGIGVANAIAAYLARKRGTIAAFKCLGASGGVIFRVYLLEALALAALGTGLGLAAGMSLPAFASGFLSQLLPVEIALAPQPLALSLAALYGVLTTLLFVLWPLGQARDLPAALLLRRDVSGEGRRPRAVYVAASALCALGLAALAVVTAQHKLIAAGACAGLLAAFALYLGLGWAIARLARALPRPGRADLSLARASLAAPGGLTRPVALSLGVSLTLLSAVALVNTSLVEEFETKIPAEAPGYYVLDIARGRAGEFERLVRTGEPELRLDRAPMLRGRIVALNGKPARESDAAPGARWVLSGDRGLTYSDTLPDGSELVAGQWWAKDHDGEPLVSFEARIAEGLGLKIGDTVTVNVLGRNLDARIANLRTVDWDSLAINFVMVFSPSALKDAPHNYLATLTFPAGAGAAREAALVQALTEAFPDVSVLRVRDAVESFRRVADKIMAAIRAAAGLTLLVGAVVLAGALATAHRRRIREAAIFKTLGAARRRIVAAHLIEYGAIAAVTGLSAAGAGTLAAWVVVTRAMDMTFTFSALAVAQAIGLAVLLVLVFGAVGTWRVLAAGTARQLAAV